jgi:hypothetical protein
MPSRNRIAPGRFQPEHYRITYEVLIGSSWERRRIDKTDRAEADEALQTLRDLEAAGDGVSPKVRVVRTTF